MGSMALLPTTFSRCLSHTLALCLCTAFPAMAQEVVPPAQELRQPEQPEPDIPAAEPAEPAKSATPTHYVAGLLVTSGPRYAGGNGRSIGLRPAWAIEHGRFRLSTARGSALMGHGLKAVEIASGVSAALIDRDRFSLRAALVVDNGRNAGDGPLLVGLPRVRSTLRARMSAGYTITQRWGVGMSVAQDVLNRQGGAQLSASMGYTMPITQQTTLNFGVGASWGDKTYMRTHFGVPASAAGTSILPPFEPGAGLHSVDAGVDVMRAINRSWVMLGGLHVAQLQGDARRSPITLRPTTLSMSIGLAYRCCR